MWIAKYAKPDAIIPHAGWHLSYMGGIKRIQHKLLSMTHQEFNSDAFNTKEHILQAMSKGKDFLPTRAKFSIADVSVLPFYVQQNEKLFQDLIVKKDSNYLYKSLYQPYLEFKKRIRLKVRQIRIIGGAKKKTLSKLFKKTS